MSLPCSKRFANERMNSSVGHNKCSRATNLFSVPYSLLWSPRPVPPVMSCFVASGCALHPLLRSIVTTHVRGHALRVHTCGRGSVSEIQPDLQAYSTGKGGVHVIISPVMIIDTTCSHSLRSVQFYNTVVSWITLFQFYIQGKECPVVQFANLAIKSTRQTNLSLRVSSAGPVPVSTRSGTAEIYLGQLAR